MLNHITLLISWKRSLITLLSIPLILIGYIYITYGELFDIILADQNLTTSFFQLNTQLNIFQNNITIVPLKTLPNVVALIGYYSVIFIYGLFLIWFIINTISTYIGLSFKQGIKYVMFLEIIGILLIFFFVINPGLNLFLSIIGFFSISLVFSMLLIYWWYEIKYLK